MPAYGRGYYGAGPYGTGGVLSYTRLTIPFTVGSGSTVGQGPQPELWTLYSTDDVSAYSPSWSDASRYVRSFNTSRGRESELGDIDAGNAEIVLDNRLRTFDPTVATAIRPLNRWWLREQFGGETQDIFYGYAESYDQQWPDKKKDAITIVRAVDEFKVLALDALPVTDPPRDTYADVIAYDNPNAHWNFNVSGDPTQALASPLPAVTGPALGTVGGFGMSGPGPILGGEGDTYSTYYNGGAGYYLQTAELSSGEGGDVAGLSAFTAELWYATSDTLANSAGDLLRGPTAGGATTWRVYIDSSGIVKADARNSGGVVSTVTATSAIRSSAGISNVWYHIAAAVSSGTFSLYINGASVASTSFTGPFAAALDANAFLRVGDPARSGSLSEWDEIAVYRTGLSAARIAAHYTAAQSGFGYGDLPHERAIDILDAAGSTAPRLIRAGTRYMKGARMKGQPPLEPIRQIQQAELTDGLLFVSRSGEVTFLDSGYRSISPWNTVQATFDDDGSDLSYHDASTDYSDTFLVNEWNLTRTGGTVVSTSDTTSIGRYFKRSQSMSDLPITEQADVTTISAALLAKYKDPMQRLATLSLSTAVPGVALIVFRREIGDRIEVFRRPPGGGAAFDQTLFIQKISVTGDPFGPWRINWVVSPL